MEHLMSEPAWLITEERWDPHRANTQETLFTVGNGYLGTRGTLEEGHRGELSGTYLNGLYDRHDSPVTDLVNVPDWLWLEVHVGGVRLDVQSCAVIEHRRTLDIGQGALFRSTLFEDHLGRRTRLESCRFASMDRREVCGLKVSLTAQNHTSDAVVLSGIDGHRRNLDRLPSYPDKPVFHPEVRWQKWALTRYLEQVDRFQHGGALGLQMRTLDTGITITAAAETRFSGEPVRRSVHQGYERIWERAEFELAPSQTLHVEKSAALVTTRRSHQDSEARGSRASDLVAESSRAGFDTSLRASRSVWESLWATSDCEIVGDAEAAQAVRFGIYHLLIAANGDDPTVNIGAKSLSGEGYRGHVFWDTEIFMLPFFIYTQPEAARNLLRYRHHTLPGARERSQQAGTSGARYAWESADTGREECPAWTVDGADRIWARDEEIHVSADVAFGIHSYLTATGDLAFLRDYGAEILFETSRFWVGRAERNPEGGGFSLKQVMGPDEFHSHVDNNAFTNHMARWHLRQAIETHQLLSEKAPDDLARLRETIDLSASEPERWAEVAEGLRYHQLSGGLIEQFDGYFDRLDVPITTWDANDMPQYPEGYHHFNCEETMLLKQPDVVMLPFMIPDDFTDDEKLVNFEFYEKRTLHKSSLSPAIHAIMGLQVGDSTRALQYFRRSAFVDLHDNQGNTAEGMHIASAAGTWQILVAGFAGFRVRGGVMSFAPWLPAQWEAISLRLCWHGNTVRVEIDQAEMTMLLEAPDGEVETVLVHGEAVTLNAEETTTIALSASHTAPRTPEGVQR